MDDAVWPAVSERRRVSYTGGVVAEPVVMVDELRVWSHGRGYWTERPSCHLTVDGTSDEHLEALHRMAQVIGLRRVWFQDKRTPHYDLDAQGREAALREGAVFVPAREQARARMARRRAGR